MENQAKDLMKSGDTAVITAKKIKEYCDVFLNNSLNDKETAQFIEIATAYNLNPFKREIYCVPYESYNKLKGCKERKLSIVTGYEVYLKRAERSGKLAGWEVKTGGKFGQSDFRGIIKIYRHDWKEPFQHEVYFSEYKQNTHIWNTKPVTMIKKVAVAQGFRMAFPDEMGGLPYTSDELPENMTKDVTEKPQVEPDLKKDKKQTAPLQI